MNLKELHVTGFGKWRNQTFTFTPGLNICTARNESGKTTLIHALVASLYGLKRDYVRVTRYLDEYELYKPWDHGTYETIVRYTLQNQNFRLHRNFMKESETAKLYSEPELTELNALYQEDKRKEFNFIEKHLGITRTVFADVTWVRSEPLAASERIIPAISREHTEDPLVRSLAQGLESELAAIGKKENAENTLFGKASKQLNTAKQALQDAQTAWQSVQHLTMSLAEWQSQLEAVLLELRRLQARREQVEQMQQDVQQWWQFHYETKEAKQMQEWINHTKAEDERAYYQAVWEQLCQIEEKEQAYLKLANSYSEMNDAERHNQSFFLRFAEIPEEEWQGWLKNWYAISANQSNSKTDAAEATDVDKLQSDYRLGMGLRSQIEEQRQQLGKLVKQAGRTTQAEQRDQAIQAEPMEPSRANRLQGRAARHRKKSNGAGRWLVRCGLVATAAILLMVSGNAGLQAYSLPIELVAGVLVVVAIGLSLKDFLFTPNQPVAQPQVVQQTKQSEELTLQISAGEQQLTEWENQLIAIAHEWGSRSWEEFLLKREEHLLEIHQSQMRKQTADEMARIQVMMERKMLDWGIPPHLSFEESAHLVLEERKEWERLTRDDQDRLESELQAERHRLELATEYEQAHRRRQTILAEWEENVREKLRAKQQVIEQEKSQLVMRIQHCEAVIVERREQIARATGEIGQRDQVSWSKAKSVYDDTAERVTNLQKRRDALILATDLLQEAWKEWHREVSPDMNEAASAIMGQITEGRYSEVRLDPLHKYAIRVIEPHTREVISQNQLSSGTQDQLYLAQRIALHQHISKEKEPLPIFMDDHFIHYDQQRLTETLHYIAELSRDHQVFLFSCQPREQQILQTLINGSDRHQIFSIGDGL